MRSPSVSPSPGPAPEARTGLRRCEVTRMRPITVCAAAVCAIGLAAPAPLAFASSGGSAARITVSPDHVHPGSTVGIQVDCSAYNNPNPTGISSQAFISTAVLHPVPGALGHFTAAATVLGSIKSGTYTVAGACEERGEQTSGFQALLTVGKPDDEHGGRHDHGRGPITGPVHTGIGGSSYSTNPAQVAIGATLVVSAGALAFWRRRRPSGAGSGDGS